MLGPRTTLLIEGTFKELIEELADYIDNTKKSQGNVESTLRSEVEPLLKKYTTAEEGDDAEEVETTRDDVLRPVVASSIALNGVPERGVPEKIPS